MQPLGISSDYVKADIVSRVRILWLKRAKVLRENDRRPGCLAETISKDFKSHDRSTSTIEVRR